MKKRFKKIPNRINYLRAGTGIGVTLVLRQESSSNFQRLRKNNLYAKQRNEVRDNINIIGTLILNRQSFQDGTRNIIISVSTLRYKCRYHICLNSKNIHTVWGVNLRDIQKIGKKASGRKSFVREVDRTLARS
jgi:hypothetical protein